MLLCLGGGGVCFRMSREIMEGPDSWLGRGKRKERIVALLCEWGTGVATISRLLKIMGLLCKKAL